MSCEKINAIYLPTPIYSQNKEQYCVLANKRVTIKMDYWNLIHFY